MWTESKAREFAWTGFDDSCFKSRVIIIIFHDLSTLDIYFAEANFGCGSYFYRSLQVRQNQIVATINWIRASSFSPADGSEETEGGFNPIELSLVSVKMTSPPFLRDCSLQDESWFLCTIQSQWQVVCSNPACGQTTFKISHQNKHIGPRHPRHRLSKTSHNTIVCDVGDTHQSILGVELLGIIC